MEAIEVEYVLRIKLNMFNVKDNYGKDGNCRLCGQEKETTEHVIECTKIPKEWKRKWGKWGKIKKGGKILQKGRRNDWARGRKLTVDKNLCGRWNGTCAFTSWSCDHGSQAW